MHGESITIPRESFEILQPILLLTRLLGILPVQYTKHGNSYKLTKSLAYCIYSYAFATVLTGSCLWGVVDDLQKDVKSSVRMKDKKARYVTSCDIAVVIIVVLAGTFTLRSRMNKFCKLLECLNQIDSIILLRKQQKLRRSSIVLIVATYAAMILVFTFDISVWTADHYCYIRNYGTFYVLYVIIISQELLFCHLIFFINIRITGLNEYLSCMRIENFDLLYRKLPFQTCGPKVNVVDVKKVVADKYTIDNMRLRDRMAALAKFQEKIVEAVQSVNNCSGYGISLITLSCLLHLIVTPYFLLTEVLKSDRNMSFISLQSIWILVHIGRLLLIVEPCQRCLDEHQKTSLLLCELSNKNFDENIKNLFAIFAMQLKCCKIQFTSCGFFKINRSLLTSFSGSVTTYLVILFQFNN